MPFTAPSLTQAQTDLANRLNDPSMVRWVAAELTLYIQEALRTWNAWTAHYRARGTLTSVASQPFYYLPTDLSGSLRAQTLTNWNVLTEIQYSLIEPATTDGTWTGSDQFTQQQVSDAIQRRRDQFLRETGSVLTRSTTLYGSPSSDGRLALAETFAVIRRAAWVDTASGTIYILQRSTDWGANHFLPGWMNSTAAPRSYSVTTVPPLTLQLIPPPSLSGTLDLVAIDRGASLNPAVQSALGVPQDFVWVIKYGALADLLNADGLCFDPQRAAYCEARWQEGLDMARRAPVVLAARIEDLTASPVVDLNLRLGSLSAADAYNPAWQATSGVPTEGLLAGQTLFALAPIPDATSPGRDVTLDVVRNAPVPTAGGDILQVGQEFYDSILDIAQHCALFKEGPAQIDLAVALLNRAARAAGVTLRLQQATNTERATAQGQQESDRRNVAEQRDAEQLPVEG